MLITYTRLDLGFIDINNSRMRASTVPVLLIIFVGSKIVGSGKNLQNGLT